MGHYQNFTLDIPARIQQLDAEFSAIADRRELEVTYLLMKASSAFLLPYERVEGLSGAPDRMPVSSHQLRVALHLDKLFLRSPYCQAPSSWTLLRVNGFSRGPQDWQENESQTSRLVVWDALSTIRHSIAHANLHFDGVEGELKRIYFGKSQDYRSKSDDYLVLRAAVADVRLLIDAWLLALRQVRAKGPDILAAIDTGPQDGSMHAHVLPA